jgi:hypothetical protein
MHSFHFVTDTFESNGKVLPACQSSSSGTNRFAVVHMALLDENAESHFETNFPDIEDNVPRSV